MSIEMFCMYFSTASVRGVNQAPCPKTTNAPHYSKHRLDLICIACERGNLSTPLLNLCNNETLSRSTKGFPPI